jgi:3-hydroxyacyl-[acyl-carrier-protein] dehydratase
MILNIQEIQKILPHRYPFLLVDRIDELEPGVRAVGIKNVTVNEAVFQGHFPGQPIFPGVLIVEALAQVGGIILLSQPQFKGRLGFLAAIENFRFRKPVLPGDTIKLEFRITRLHRSIAWGEGKAEVNGNVIAEGQLTFAIMKETTDETRQH